MSTEGRSCERFFLCGVSYKATPVELREKFAIAESEYSGALELLLSIPEVREGAIISTCNRMEVVAVANNVSDRFKVIQGLEDFFSQTSGVERNQFFQGLYHFQGVDAVRHLFHVACGLDSLVVGEPQILGQLKDAYRRAREAGSAGPLINGLFHQAFRAAKNVRSSTGIGKNAVSVCYAARELAGHIFGDLQSASVMLIGAGDTGELALKYFIKAGVRKIFVCNRTLARALALSERYGAVALSLGQLPEFLAEADIIIGAASMSPGAEALVTQAHISSSQAARRSEPQFLIDLAVPRNFHPQIGSHSDVFLYNVDHLEKIVAENIAGRLGEVDKASSMLDGWTDDFLRWLDVRRLDPEIVAIRERCLSDADKELERTMKSLRRRGLDNCALEAVREQLQFNNQALVKRLLHPLIHTLKDRGVHDPDLVAAAKSLLLEQEIEDSDYD